VAAGLLSGVAVVSLFSGFETPLLFGVALVSAVSAYLAYRYAADQMVQAVYAGVGTPTAADGRAADGGTEPLAGTAEGVDSATAATEAGGEGYDEWTWAWADVDADDPFWSDDEEDWTDPWEANMTDPSDASNGEWQTNRGASNRNNQSRSRWWKERTGSQDRTDRANGATDGEDDAHHQDHWWERMGEEDGAGRSQSERTKPKPRTADRTAEAYAVLGLEPGVGPEAVRAAYRERVKEAHPDTPEGTVEAFIEVREAYQYLRERLSGTDGPK
jgi:hypothetical protein